MWSATVALPSKSRLWRGAAKGSVMAIPVDKPIICPVLIGRTSHLDLLHECIDRALADMEQYLLISGEAGIGKSRLVAEAKVYAAARGCLLLQGACFEPDRSAPYAPFLEILRTRVNEQATGSMPTDAELDLSELCELLPELRPLLRARHGRQADVTTIDPGQMKRRLFATLADYFAKEAAHRPLLLVVED